MKILKCECCGGTLKPSLNKTNEYICEYCGSKYESNNPDIAPIRIETYQSPIRTLKVKECVDDYVIEHLGEEATAAMSMRNITNKLAEALAPCIELEKTYDPVYMQHIITAKVRVVEANYRF